MSDDREFRRATADWLEAGSDRTPPAAVNAVLLAVRTTRQDQPLPVPWRSLPMPSFPRLMVAAVAVVAIVFAWFNLAPPRSDVGGVAGPSASASPAPTPSPSPTPIPIAQGNSTPGSPLQAGARYTTVDPFPVAVSFVAPEGWVANIGGQYAVWAGPAATGDDLRFQFFSKVYSDPCHPDKGVVVVDGTAAGLVNAIIGRPGLGATHLTSTTLGGQPATTFSLGLDRLPAGCISGVYRIWELPGGATNELQRRMGEHVWVVETSAGPLVVSEVYSTDGTSAPAFGLQGVLDSLEIAP